MKKIPNYQIIPGSCKWTDYPQPNSENNNKQLPVHPHVHITFSNATIKLSLAVVNGLSTAKLRK